MLETFRHQSIFYPGMITYGVNLAMARTGTMVFTQVIDPEPNIAALDNRAVWLPQLYMDSQQLEITCLRYGDKVQLNKYDEMITYWQENGQAGLRRIMQNRLAPHMVQSLDLLARNAFLSKATVMFQGNRSGFEALLKTDTFNLEVCRAVQLGADYQPDPKDNPIISVTSPSAIYTIRDTDAGEFIARRLYTDNRLTVNYEVGEYEGVRMSRHPILTLWNCGHKLAQTTIAASISLGDGAPDPSTTKVEDVWQVGQAGATHYITVASTSDFSAGDYVSLHVYRQGDSSTYDSALAAKLKATQAPLLNDPTKIEREIQAVVDGTKLRFTKPITTDDFQTDLGGGVYGYVTKGRPIHASIFLKGPRGVVSGVLQPPQTYTPAPVDDTESIWRFAWDAYLKFQQMYPHRFEVYFFAGPVRQLGQVVNL